MTENAVSVTPEKAGEIMEAIVARGDIVSLTPQERAKYYIRVCESLGLNPMTRPFEYVTLNGKLQLYARKDATDQLRNLHDISVTELAESERDGVLVVTAKVEKSDGRTDMAKGAVSIAGLKGEALANAIMKAETKAKRRATLSICGLGFPDETEIEDVREQKPHAGQQSAGPAALDKFASAEPLTPTSPVFTVKIGPDSNPPHDPVTGEIKDEQTDPPPSIILADVQKRFPNAPPDFHTGYIAMSNGETTPSEDVRKNPGRMKAWLAGSNTRREELEKK